MILVDSNVLLDLVTADPVWADWSRRQIARAAVTDVLAINEAVFAELSVRYTSLASLESMLQRIPAIFVSTPQLALFLAGKAFLRYRAAGGVRTGVLPDFFIGAHAAISGLPLLTRDARRYRTYFPGVHLIAPY